MAISFLTDGPADATHSILLAHGAGAPMDSTAMTAMAEALGSQNFAVARFEFDYMAERRRSGKRSPPPKIETLFTEYRNAIDQLAAIRPLIVGGKSMGGRVASMIADDLHASGIIVGLLCLGYPFHPIGQPAKLRTGHLQAMTTPTLICQGSRDAFGNVEDVSDYPLSERITVHWLADGDHDFKPRKSVSGLSHNDHIADMAKATRQWADALAG